MNALRRISGLTLGLSLGLGLALTPNSAGAGIEVDGQTLEVIDVHLHSGNFGQLAPSGKGYLISGTPSFTQLYAPGIFNRLLDPYAAHIGIRAQTEMAGFDHAVVLATYTHETTGYFTNTQLLGYLRDERNVDFDDGSDEPWAWGLASINFFDDYAGNVEARLAALDSFFAEQGDWMIGVKLAHAHQAVPLDAPEFLGVYDVAAKHGVPVLLHTGFSPFPNSQTDPEFYDPSYLDSVVSNYDGSGSAGRVDFVLSHVGQGDLRATENALSLAETYDNVYLEISALNRPARLGLDGEELDSTTPQYVYVLEQIKARGLIGKTLFATDGAQFSGFVSSYLELMVSGMRDANYTVEEMAQVLAGNFHALYGV